MERINEAQVVRVMKFEDVVEQVDQLPVEQRTELARRLLGHGERIIIIGGNNMISNSNVLQLNGSAEEISKQLKNVSPEILEELVKAIALSISKDNNSH